MKNEVLVYFTRNNARILVNPENAVELKKLPQVMVDPDLSHLIGIPPHLWKQGHNQIYVMTPEEAHARMLDIDKNGADNLIWIPMSGALAVSPVAISLWATLVAFFKRIFGIS